MAVKPPAKRANGERHWRESGNTVPLANCTKLPWFSDFSCLLCNLIDLPYAFALSMQSLKSPLSPLHVASSSVLEDFKASHDEGGGILEIS